jgi:exonuclease SbcC
LNIEISGYTPIKNGKEIREKIYTKVYRGGIEASFATYSGGERARIEAAIILAMHTIINQSTEGKGIDLIILDEIIESIDSLGIINLLKSLNKLNLNILIITHATINQNHEYVLNIEKNNGVSEIIK